jgi:hypothetical protein
MLLQFEMVGYEWMIALGLMFGLAFVMNLITFDSMSSFFIWLTIFNAIVVWGGLLPLWTLVLCLILLTVVIYFEMKNKGGNG